MSVKPLNVHLLYLFFKLRIDHNHTTNIINKILLGVIGTYRELHADKKFLPV